MGGNHEGALRAALDDSTFARIAARALMVCVASFAGARVGAWLHFPELGTAILFPPYAILTTALLVSRPRNWIIYLVAASVGTFAPHLAQGWPSSFVLMAELANWVRALVAASALRKLVPTTAPFANFRATGLFLAVVVAIAPSVAALLGATVVVIHAPTTDFWLAWREWTLSNAVTGLTIVPMLLAAARFVARPVARWDRWLEALVLALGLLAASALTFDRHPQHMLAGLYWPLPFLLWAAVRFGPNTTSAALATITGLAVWGGLHGRGPFTDQSVTENIIQVQLLVIAIATPVLLLSALVEQQRRTATALARSEAHYRSVVEDQTELICRYRPDGTCTFVNDAYCRWVGQPEAVLLGSNLRNVDPALDIRLVDPPTSADPVVTRESSTTGSGGTIVQQWRDRAFFDDRGNVIEYQSVGRDVTERAHIEEKRREIEAQKRVELALREESRRKDEFLAMLSHELRNPLAPMVTAVDLMKLKNAQTTSNEQEIVSRHLKNVVRIVDDLLDVARVTRGKIELRLELCELSSIVANAVEMATPLAAERAQNLSVSVPTRGLAVVADPVRLAQAIANVLTNASKYTDRGGEIRVVAAVEGPDAVVRVRDTGIGIAPEMLPRVFELFAQERSTIDRAKGGLGIGLTVVKGLLELHGGSVVAHSEGQGKGTEIVIRVPLVTTTADLPSEPCASRPLVNGDGLRVLVVDDNIDAAKVLGEALVMFGCAVEIAHDGATALDAAATFEPHLALVDIGLPVMNGYEVAERLRCLDAAPKRIVAITGYGQQKDRARSRDAGFDEHMVKPLELEMVREIVDRGVAACAR